MLSLVYYWVSVERIPKRVIKVQTFFYEKAKRIKHFKTMLFICLLKWLYLKIFQNLFQRIWIIASLVNFNVKILDLFKQRRCVSFHLKAIAKSFLFDSNFFSSFFTCDFSENAIRVYKRWIFNIKLSKQLLSWVEFWWDRWIDQENSFCCSFMKSK